MENDDIRWKQRYRNFSKALSQLKKFIDKGKDLNELEKQGMIQAFEYNFELAWNLIKDYLEYQGLSNIIGSRDAFRLAYNRGLIDRGEEWMKMIESRIKTSHTYNEDTAEEIAGDVLNSYFQLFTALHITMEEIIRGQEGTSKQDSQ
jgi:nucleotidyltransferase substrate binding protein (TIGR01987 family)